MKSILIVNNNMKIGGIQKSLYNLLWTIHDEYRITLLLFESSGELLKDLPPDIEVISCTSWFRYLGISQAETEGRLKDMLVRGGLSIITRVVGRHAAMRLILRTERGLKREFDSAISFIHSVDDHLFYGGTTEFVLYKTNAGIKTAFLHCDYVKAGGNSPNNNKLYKQFDYIAACSEGCRRAFLKVLPELEMRCVTVQNCHRYDVIRKMADEAPMEYSHNTSNLLFVGRLGEEKGVNRGIRALHYVINKGYSAVLHIVGDGQEMKPLKDLAEELGLTHAIHFYGEQSNPYRYMKNADLLIVSSYHEAAPMVIDEAICLGLPVLTTKTTSTREMVLERDAGWECENSQEGLDQTLAGILKSPDVLKKVKERLSSCRTDNKTATEQFKKLLQPSSCS